MISLNKHPENVFLIIFADVLEKKSKLRNFLKQIYKTSMYSMLFG